MVDKVKLDALRAKYAEGKGSDVFDPEFKKVVSLVFQGADRRKLPYGDVATLLDAPYRGDAQAAVDFAGLDVALVGVPMDLGVTNRSGARLGPRAVRAVGRIGPYEHALGLAPALHVNAADIGDVPMKSRFSLEECHSDIEAFFGRVRAAGVIPLAVGGDHSITYPILKALGRDRPVGMVHIDAHCDTGGTFEGSKFHHGGPFRQAVLEGALDPERSIQIGIHGGAEYLWEFSADSGMTVLQVEDVAKMGVPAVIDKAREVIGDGPTYITFDIDGIDPGFAPGTGTPEVGGLTPREVLAILRGIAGAHIIGGDVVEVAPQYDATTSTTQKLWGLARRREGWCVAVAGTVGSGVAPAAEAAARWPSRVESLLTIAAIVALFPAFDRLAADDLGREGRFSDTALVIGGLPERSLPGLCASHGLLAEPLVRDRLCRRSELRSG